MLFLCCHPALSPSAQAALTLRAVAGLTTAEIARAYLVPEATMAQRISRAKQRIRDSGASFRLPPDAERSDRLRVVLQVLYLLFNEGYTAMSGPTLVRPDLTAEAIRLARDLLRLVPDDGEVAGLLALMLLVDARRPARTGPDGALVPLAEQDRTRWDRRAIAEGVALVTASLASKPLGPYQLQAAIAAVHDEAPTRRGHRLAADPGALPAARADGPGPTVTLNRAVAEAMVHGPRAGLDLLATLTVDDRVSGAHRFDAVRAHLLEMAGEHREAVRDLPAGRPPDREHPRTPLPARPRQVPPTGRARRVVTTKVPSTLAGRSAAGRRLLHAVPRSTQAPPTCAVNRCCVRRSSPARRPPRACAPRPTP